MSKLSRMTPQNCPAMMLPMLRLKLTVQYDGTAYCGWQRQPDPTPTVQRTIEKTVLATFDQHVTVQGASRTDTGVHALGQVALMELSTHLDPDRVRKALNSRLPDDILIRKVEVVPETFRLWQATRKCYKYSIWADRDRPVFSRQFVYHFYRPLDLQPMQAACDAFVGEYDFEAFKGRQDHRENSVRRIFSCNITKQGKMLTFEVHGNGFLYHMVRTMVGTVVDVGLGRYGPEKILQIINSRDRRMAGQTLPAQGLCLHWIEFGAATDAPPAGENDE